MRVVAWAGFALAGFVGGVETLQATEPPAIVIPGKRGVPVIIDGYDASYTVVEGDVGLDRPGHMPATIVSGPLVVPHPYYPGSYFPVLGRKPGYGRYEIEPPANRRRPPPAESYHRSWGASSDPLPASIDPQTNMSVNVEPQVYGRDPRRRDQRDDRRQSQSQKKQPQRGAKHR